MSYKSENWKEKLEQVRNHIALKEGSVEKSADDILNDQIEESLNSIEEDVVEVQEVTDKEINAVKKLSKLIEKAKKDYFKIAKMGDKTLKDTKFNEKYESILKAQQEILSLIGELSNQKMMQKEGVETLDEKSKDVRKRYRGKEQKSVNSLIMQNGVDKIQKLFDDEPKEFDALIGRLAKLESVEHDEIVLGEAGMGDKIGKLFRTKDKKEIDGIANLMNMTSVKVLQAMMKQNPQGFKRMAKKMGELPAMEEKEILNSFELNEVTDKEINMAKKLSKDMEKVKKGYQQIAKTGDKTLKSTGFNATYESILKAQQKVLSLIGELTTMKQISDRSASRKKDAQGRPIMSSNIMDSYREMREDELKEESITYQLKIKNKNGPEYKKFEKSARMMKLKMSSKMNAGNKLVAVLNGTKKNLRDFDSVVRGRQSYGDPSTIKHFDEK